MSTCPDESSPTAYFGKASKCDRNCCSFTTDDDFIGFQLFGFYGLFASYAYVATLECLQYPLANHNISSRPKQYFLIFESLILFPLSKFQCAKHKSLIAHHLHEGIKQRKFPKAVQQSKILKSSIFQNRQQKDLGLIISGNQQISGAFRSKQQIAMRFNYQLRTCNLQQYQQYLRVDSKLMNLAVDKAKLIDYTSKHTINIQFEEFLRAQSLSARLKIFKMTPISLAELCNTINNKCLKTPDNVLGSSSIDTTKWIKGEFKLFIWVSVFYIFNERIPNHQLKQSDYQFLSTIFLTKTPEKMRYQLMFLYPPPKYNSRQVWSEQETKLFQKLMQSEISEQKELSWKSIATKLFTLSQGKYFRTFGQCRQMWLNHLNPNLDKTQWTKEQDYLLMTLVRQHDKSWGKIAQKFLQKRTGHMIKNRYHSLIKVGKKTNSKLADRQIENKLLRCLASALKKQRKRQCSNQDFINNGQPLSIQVKPDTKYLESDREKSDINLAENQTKTLVHYRQCLGEFELDQQRRNYSTQSQTENQEQLELNFLDLNFTDIPKQFASDDLLQKLGCSHMEQVYEAFKRDSSLDLIFQK